MDSTKADAYHFPRSASASGSRTERRPFDPPALPSHTATHEYGVAANPYHTPTESVSSNDSTNSGGHTNSSRSSPPTSAGLFGQDRKLSDASHTKNPSISGANAFPHPRRGPTKSFSRPLYVRPVETEHQHQPESPMDPALASGRWPTTRDEPKEFHQNTYPARTPHFHEPALSPALPFEKPKQTKTPARRPTVGNKGHCRGCGELITGKSVSSADGRLTGRYHKECFVCKTCKEPFRTTDFYVLKNNPYCNRHYHELNGSLCTNCDRGIEGQYLETDLKQKFHSHCFTCRVSHLVTAMQFTAD